MGGKDKSVQILGRQQPDLLGETSFQAVLFTYQCQVYVRQQEKETLLGPKILQSYQTPEIV